MNEIIAKKIFIVDDDPEIINWLKMKIKNLENLLFSGAYFKFEGAFEKIRQVNPDIVVLDLRLPDGNGINILKKIKKEDINITIIVYSMNVEAKKSCLKYGAHYFFDKSDESINLLERLNSISKK